MVDKTGRYLSDEARQSMGGHTRFKPKHGMKNTPEYATWNSMKSRCYCPGATSYKNYGAKGIGVCNRWQTFESFYADMGKRPEGYTLDRIDPSKDYSPENCRWATPEQQAVNKRDTIRVEYLGKSYNLTELAKLSGLKRDTLYSRIRKGWSVEQAVQPVTVHP